MTTPLTTNPMLAKPTTSPTTGATQVAARSRPDKISVLLVDDQELLRSGLRMVLEEEPDLMVVGEAADGEQGVRMALALRPHVVLMDMRMPGMDGVEATRRITAEAPGSRVLALTTFDLDEYAVSALRYGASGFLLKDVRPGELVDAIRTVAEGDAVVAPSVTRRLLDAYANRLPDLREPAATASRASALGTLTDREGEILIHVASGLSNLEIAEKLSVSEATVKTHLGRVLAKLGLRDRVHAVIFAYEHGLVRPGSRAT
jgi:DNA-binding NarL/FixJ family response regulator